MKKPQIIISLLLIAYTLYQVWLNGLFPYINDDIFYQYIIMYNLDHPVESVNDIIQSQYLHYHNINGRSIIHTIEQFILLLSPDKQLFNILNAIVWTTLLCLIVTYATARDRRSWIHWLIAIIYLRFLSANSQYLACWASGSFNYYWASVFIILLLFVYRRNRKSCATYLYPLYFIFAVLAGWSHETLITGILAAVIVEWILQKQWKSPLPTVILTGLLTGYAIMFFAPGNFVKLEAVKPAGGSSLILILATASQFKMVLVLLLMLCCGAIIQRKNTLDFIVRNRFLIIATAVDMLSCLIIGVGGRAIFFAETFAVILILRYLSIIAVKFNTASIRWSIPFIAALVAYEACYAHDWNKIYREINHTITSYINNDTDQDYIISDIPQPHPITAPLILSSDQFWSNHYNFSTLSAIHKKEFRIMPSDIHRAIKDDTLFATENRLEKGLQFYTTDSIDWLVMPCDTVPPQGQYTFLLCQASPDDPDINLTGKLRRKIAPGSYPSTYTPHNYSANPSKAFAVEDKYYIILQKPPYRRVEAVYFEPQK